MKELYKKWTPLHSLSSMCKHCLIWASSQGTCIYLDFPKWGSIQQNDLLCIYFNVFTSIYRAKIVTQIVDVRYKLTC